MICRVAAGQYRNGTVYGQTLGQIHDGIVGDAVAAAQSLVEVKCQRTGLDRNIVR